MSQKSKKLQMERNLLEKWRQMLMSKELNPERITTRLMG